MYTIKSETFFCFWCNMNFSQTDENGVAICPTCGRKRNDGLNQIGLNQFQCIACKCVFLNALKLGPACPNGCKYPGGKK